MSVTKVDPYFARHPVITDLEMSVEEAHEMMRKMNIRHLPVVKGKKAVGIVSERDLLKALNLESSKDLRVEDVMTPEPYVVQRGTSVLEIVQTMIETKMGSALVEDKTGQIIGIFTTIDALKVLEEFLEDEGDSEFDEVFWQEFEPSESWRSVLA